MTLVMVKGLMFTAKEPFCLQPQERARSHRKVDSAKRTRLSIAVTGPKPISSGLRVAAEHESQEASYGTN